MISESGKDSSQQTVVSFGTISTSLLLVFPYVQLYLSSSLHIKRNTDSRNAGQARRRVKSPSLVPMCNREHVNIVDIRRRLRTRFAAQRTVGMDRPQQSSECWVTAYRLLRTSVLLTPASHGSDVTTPGIGFAPKSEEDICCKLCYSNSPRLLLQTGNSYMYN